MVQAEISTGILKLFSGYLFPYWDRYTICTCFSLKKKTRIQKKNLTNLNNQKYYSRNETRVEYLVIEDIVLPLLYDTFFLESKRKIKGLMIEFIGITAMVV